MLFFGLLTAVLGFSLGPLFPAGMQYSEVLFDRVVEGKLATAFVVGSALGDMLIPVLLGWLFAVAHEWFVYGSCLVGLCAFGIFVAMRRVKKRKGNDKAL